MRVDNGMTSQKQGIRRRLRNRNGRTYPVWRLGLMLALAATALGCRTTPENVDPDFTRAGLLREAIEERLAADDPRRATNLVSRALEMESFGPLDIRGYLDALYRHELDTYRSAIAADRFEAAMVATANLAVLDEAISRARQRWPDASWDDGESAWIDGASTRSRDQILLDWAERELERDEPVLALYLLLRRSTLGDLDPDELADYAAVAERLNHTEALERIGRIIEVEATTPNDAARMLQGTVTVWVNRGIRLEQGVGVPDRVIGSGFFVDPRGYLLTNYHVISSEVDPEYEGFSRLFVKLPGRPDERVPARVIGYDRIFDLALLKVEIDPAYVFSLSDTRVLQPGERVLALGSPGGLDSTVTSGIVSAAGRRFLQMGEAVQVDVPINPGNSGGPLVLPDGQVAGVVFAGIEQFEGVNFAIPSYWIRHFFPRLFETGEVVHAWLGVSAYETDEGLEVVYVAPGSPAADAGIKPGEILTSIAGTAVTKLAGAQDILMELRPGSLVSTVWQSRDEDGALASTWRVLATAPRPFSPVEEALERQPIEDLFPVLYGMDVDSVSGAPWGPDFVITGVLPGSIADESSLSVDDPFALRDWAVDRDLRAAFIQIIIKKRKAGFLESGVQLGAYLETDSFL